MVIDPTIHVDPAKTVSQDSRDYIEAGTIPEVVHEFVRALLIVYLGLNVAASRATTGNHRIYSQLENRLARFFSAEAAALVSSGYLSNLAVAQALAGEFTHAFVDARYPKQVWELETPLPATELRPEHVPAETKRELLPIVGKYLS